MPTNTYTLPAMLTPAQIPDAAFFQDITHPAAPHVGPFMASDRDATNTYTYNPDNGALFHLSHFLFEIRSRQLNISDFPTRFLAAENWEKILTFVQRHAATIWQNPEDIYGPHKTTYFRLQAACQQDDADTVVASLSAWDGNSQLSAGPGDGVLMMPRHSCPPDSSCSPCAFSLYRLAQMLAFVHRHQSYIHGLAFGVHYHFPITPTPPTVALPPTPEQPDAPSLPRAARGNRLAPATFNGWEIAETLPTVCFHGYAAKRISRFLRRLMQCRNRGLISSVSFDKVCVMFQRLSSAHDVARMLAGIDALNKHAGGRQAVKDIDAGQRWARDLGGSRVWENLIDAFQDLTHARKDLSKRPTRKDLKAELSSAQDLLLRTRPKDWRQETHWLMPYVADKQFPKGQCYGIEIEFVLNGNYSTDEDGDVCDDSSCQFTSEQLKTVVPMANLHGDGSVEAGDGQTNNRDGEEIGLLINRNNPQPLKDLCRFLAQKYAEVNNSCGLHVHLDCRDVGRSGALGRARRLQAALPWLLFLQPQSRRNNSYCRPIMSETDRYSAVNFTAFDEHQTVEVRLAAGSVNFDKIYMWAELCYWLTRHRNYIRSWRDFIESNAPDALKEWALSRFKAFAKHNPNPEDLV